MAKGWGENWIYLFNNLILNQCAYFCVWIKKNNLKKKKKKDEVRKITPTRNLNLINIYLLQGTPSPWKKNNLKRKKERTEVCTCLIITSNLISIQVSKIVKNKFIEILQNIINKARNELSSYQKETIAASDSHIPARHGSCWTTTSKSGQFQLSHQNEFSHPVLMATLASQGIAGIFSCAERVCLHDRNAPARASKGIYSSLPYSQVRQLHGTIGPRFNQTRSSTALLLVFAEVILP